jgi:hypothetical protein
MNLLNRYGPGYCKQFHEYRMSVNPGCLTNYKDWKIAYGNEGIGFQKKCLDEFKEYKNMKETTGVTAAALGYACTFYKPNNMFVIDDIIHDEVKCVSTESISKADFCKAKKALLAKNPWVKAVKKEKEKESDMNYTAQVAMGDSRTEAQQAKEYLIQSLNGAISTKEQEASKAFNIGRKAVSTMGDLRKAVAGSWFQVDKRYDEIKDDVEIYYCFDYLTIKNPEWSEDREAFAEAKKQIRKEASDVKDQIVVMGAEKGLEALNGFKAKTFH